MNKELDTMELCEKMFTEYVNPDFEKVNKENFNLVLIGYGLYNCCYDSSDLEDQLIRDFGDLIVKYENGVKLTGPEIERLKNVYEESELNDFVERVKNGYIYEIGNNYAAEDYIIEYLDDLYGVNNFIERFTNYIDWGDLLPDVCEELDIVSFDDIYYQLNY